MRKPLILAEVELALVGFAVAELVTKLRTMKAEAEAEGMANPELDGYLVVLTGGTLDVEPIPGLVSRLGPPPFDIRSRLAESWRDATPVTPHDEPRHPADYAEDTASPTAT